MPWSTNFAFLVFYIFRFFPLPEIYGTDVCDDKGRVEEGIAEYGRSEDQVGVVERDHLPARRHVEVVGGEDHHQHVGAEEDHHQLAEDVDVEDLNVEVSHCALSEGEYVVGCAEDHDDVVDEEGDEDVVEEKVVGGDVAANIFADEVNWHHSKKKIPHLCKYHSERKVPSCHIADWSALMYIKS